jgi:hypothetical protein
MRSLSKGAYRVALAAGLAAMVAWSGCKKDEPAATAPPAPAAAGKAEGAAKTPPTEAPKAEEGKKDGAGADPGKPAGGDATGKPADPPKAGGTDPAGAAADPGKAQPAGGAEIGQISVPDNVIVVAGASSLQDLIKTANDAVGLVAGMPPVDRQVTEGLTGALRLGNLDWLDQTKPVRMLVLDPKESPDGALVAFPMKSKDDFVKALPENKQDGVGGNAHSYEAGFSKFYVNFAGDYVVLGSSETAWSKAESFVKGPLMGYAPKQPLEVRAQVATLLRIFKSEYDMAREEAGKALAGLEGDGMGGTLKGELQMFFDLVDSLERAQFTLRKDDVHAILGVGLTPKPNAPNKGFYAAYKGRKIPLMDQVPENSYFVVAGSSDPKAGLDWMATSGKALLETSLREALGMSAEEVATIIKIQEKVTAISTGEFMLAFHPEGQAPLSLSSVTTVSSGEEARKAFLEVMGVVWPKAAELIKKEQAELPPGVDISSFASTVRTVGDLLRPQGVVLEVREEQDSGMQVDTLEVKVDWSAVSKMAGGAAGGEMPTEMRDAQAVMGDKLQITLAYGKDRYAMALGAEGARRAKALASGGMGSAPSGLRDAVTKGVPSAAAIIYISAIDAIRAFSKVSALQGFASKLDAMRPTNGVAITMGTGTDDSLLLAVDVPLDHVKMLVELFGGP